MAGQLSDEGLFSLWANALDAPVTPYSFQIVLFTNNFTPVATQVLADFTLDITTEQLIAGNLWAFSLNPTLHYEQAVQSFTFPVSVPGTTYYGALIYNTSLGVSVYAELFSTPYIVPSGGGTLIYTPTLEFHNC